MARPPIIGVRIYRNGDLVDGFWWNAENRFEPMRFFARREYQALAEAKQKLPYVRDIALIEKGEIASWVKKLFQSFECQDAHLAYLLGKKRVPIRVSKWEKTEEGYARLYRDDMRLDALFAMINEKIELGKIDYSTLEFCEAHLGRKISDTTEITPSEIRLLTGAIRQF